MALTVVRTWQQGLATSGPALPQYTPWWQSSSASRNVVWVDSNSTATGDGTEDRPYTTMEDAYADADIVTAESGIIVVRANHTQTISSAATMSKTGLTIIGLGSGTSKPAFTSAVAGAMWTMSGARQHIYNCRFPASTAASTGRVVSSADDFLLEDCDFTSGTSDTSDVAVSCTGHTPDVAGCTFTSSGSTSARPNIALRFNTASHESPRVSNCSFYAGTAGWSLGIHVGGAALDFKFRNLTFTGVKTIVRVVTGSRGWIAGVTGPGVVEWPI